MNKKYLNIALHCPLDQVFDYQPPADQAISSYPIGARVLVPFGRTEKIGLIIDHADQTNIAQNKIRHALAVLDASPLLDEKSLAFLRWVGNYYHHPIGEVLLAALPLRLRKQKQTLSLSRQYCRLLLPLPDALAMLTRAPRQQAMVQAIAAAGETGYALDRLRQQFSGNRDALQRLLERKVIALVDQAPVPDAMQWQDAPYPLNTEQQAAIQAIQNQLNQFKPFLLDGITGSGKTEVYLQLARLVLQQGRNVLLLVPEIALTPQLAQRFRERLGECIAIMHSGLNETERELAWHQARLGLSRLVIGTRSLIFYPIAKLGLILVDEEHDLSFKQQDGLRYSARDLAIIRAQRAQCPVILGSATPSLESLQNAKRGRYQHLKLSQRTGKAKPPEMRILDVRDQPLQAGISATSLKAIATTLANQQQALVFINRRGYAPVLSCHACGWLSDCPHCDAHQTVHYATNLLICHHCGAQRSIPLVCPSCGSPELHPLGQGTEKIETFLSNHFADIPLLRIDRDTTMRKNSLAELLRQVQQPGPALLIGTQMLAKGHHFPRVTLVCVLEVDTGLFSADFRATERMAQLLLQVAGRAGRGDQPGQVLIQSRYPDHPLLEVLVRDGYAAFAEVALAERLQVGYPPFSHQILLRADSKKAEQAEDFLRSAADWAKQQPDKLLECWGPVPAPMARRAGRSRSHLLLQSQSREALHQALLGLGVYLQAVPLKNKVRWSLDVDPYEGY